MPLPTPFRAVLFLTSALACGCAGADDPPASTAASSGGAASAPADADPPTPESAPPPATGAQCGTIAGLGCPEGQYCDYAAGDGCGVADGAGVCKPRPEACTMDYVPVCGCDGRTYGNACGAAAAGMSVARDGECGSQP